MSKELTETQYLVLVKSIQDTKNRPYYHPALTGPGRFAVDLNGSRICPYVVLEATFAAENKSTKTE